MGLVFGLCLLAGVIEMPEDVASVSRLVRAEKDLIIVDGRGITLWSTDQKGNTSLAYHKEGPGPGELKNLYSVDYYGGLLYMCDIPAGKIVV